jgi:hypothetical protein
MLEDEIGINEHHTGARILDRILPLKNLLWTRDKQSRFSTLTLSEQLDKLADKVGLETG